MRSRRFGLLFCILFLAVQGWTRQASTSPQTQPTAPKDPQAVNIVNQALAPAGGMSALMAVTDYTASGTVIFNEGQDVQGAVTVSGLGLTDFRQDATLPTGVRSFGIINGQAAIKNEDGTTRLLNFRYQTPLMISSVLIPCWQLAAALNDPLFGLSYKGTTQIEGYTVYDIRIQLMPPGPPDPNGVIAEYFGADFFIDTSTFQVRMIQDVVIEHFVRQIRYSNYTAVNGVVVPFLINEEINGHPAQTLQLNQIVFNSGLQEAAFKL